ncbi:cytosolic protein [Photobacterium aquae]|uniref:Cytosolic protein n=1 Tax=Photobacterium aquae TaxID=1195763 RepID=A0A0J1GZM3_9GAMM|nr:DUF58 domain-containing protein [Photobacterium aquae]KLV05073.1 cytosolic protein [Photobacterium aquae]
MKNQATSLALPRHSDGVNVCLAELIQYKNQTVRWLAPAHSIWSQLSGKHQSRHKGRGMDFAEVRPYQPGDDIRAIDWRVTARSGKTHTKLFTEEREQPVMLLVDLSTSMQFGSTLMLKSVQAAHFASLLSWLTVAEQDRIGAVIFTDQQITECKPRSRQQGALHVINALINAQTQQLSNLGQPSSQRFSDALKRLAHLCPKGSEIVIISDFYQLTENDRRRLSQLRQHNRIQFVHLSDPLEAGQTPYRGTAFVTDDQQSTWIDFSASKTRHGLSQLYDDQQQFLHAFCKRMAVPLHSISAAIPLLTQLGQLNGHSYTSFSEQLITGGAND